MGWWRKLVAAAALLSAPAACSARTLITFDVDGTLVHSASRAAERSAHARAFGSDYCSGEIDDLARNHLDRAEQIAIAVRRARALLVADGDERQLRGGSAGKGTEQPGAREDADAQITRVVHVGDAQSDVLAAKACADDGRFGHGVCVVCIAVGTGRYTPDQLREVAGAAREGAWEPHVVPDGLADPHFVELALGRLAPAARRRR
jgi:phosphoglycolate phosphatase-like HAD superfamily hydrolase